MKKINKKKAITTVTGVAVLGVAVTALGNASELETLFNPSKFEKFQNQNRTEEYDYMAGEGDNVDLADKDKNGEQNSGDDQDQQVLQIKKEQQEDNKSTDTLGIVNENKTPEQNTDNAKKTGVELDNTRQNNNTSNTNRSDTSGNKNRTDSSQKDNKKNTGSNNNNGNGKNDSNKDNNENNKNDNKKDDNSNHNGDNNNDNNGDNNTLTTVTPSPTPSLTPIPEALKPRDPYVTEDGQTLKSIHAEITREYYCKGDRFSQEDAVVTAMFQNKDGSTETKTLFYGGTNGYQISLSTSLTGKQTAVFRYKGMTCRASYKVLSNVVFLNYMAAFSNDDKYYFSAFPGEALKDILGESGYKVLKELTDTEKCQPVSGSVVNLLEVHRRMIAILGNPEMQTAFRNWTSGGSYQDLVFFEEDSDGYLTNMLEGFSCVSNGALQDNRSYIFYPVTDWGNAGRNIVDVVAKVPDGYKIRRVTENDSDMSRYRGDQVLEKYTGSDREISVPMGVTKISLKAKAEGVTTLVLPQSVQSIEFDSLYENLPDLISYKAADDLVSLQDYSIKDGVLYSKDGKTLLSVPAGRKEVIIPDTVKYLGEGCLKGLSKDAVVHFEGEKTPVLKGKTGYKGTILVPDSDYDAICKRYMFFFGKECSEIIFGSEHGEAGLYTWKERGPVLVYTKEQNVLSAIPENTKGEYTVKNPITAVGTGAFSSCDKLTDIVLGEGVTVLQEGSLVFGDNVETITLKESSVTVSDKVFGDLAQGATVPDIQIYVNQEAYEDYLKSWSEVLDPVYGEGTAARLLVAEKDSYIYEDGIKYQEISSQKGTSYKLIRMYQKDKTSCKIKENTVSVNANAFVGCNKLEIIYIPSTVTGIPADCFEICSSLETVASENGELFKKEEIKLPENAELMLAGRDFTSFIYEEGVLNGTAEDGTHVLLNVVTDYAKQVNIKENTVSYYKKALKGCTQITGIYDPSPVKLKEIGEECFEDCTEITYFDFSDCPNLETVGTGAFRNCTALTQITFSDSVKKIGEEAFYGCESLKQIGMTGVEEIGDRAFYECDRLRVTGELDRLRILGSQVFFSCRDLRSMTLPDDLESIGEGCFENCTELSNVEINGSLTAISRYCFYGCKKLVQVTFADAVTRSGALKIIGVEAFAQCTNLEKIDFSNLNALTLMGENTFEGCTSLTTVKFPESFQKLPDNCFEGCKNLSIVQFQGNNIVKLGKNVFGSTLPTFLHIWVQSDKVNEYQTAYSPVLDPVYGEGTTADILGEINDKTEIVQGVLFEITEEGKVLVSVSADLEGEYVVPSDTVRIAEDAFAGCDKLTKLGIGFNTTVSLGDRCFKGCQNLSYVEIQGSVPEWGEETFMDCPKLAQVYIGAGVNGSYAQIDRIGTRAFKNCTALTGDYCMGIRTGIKVLGEECFAGCTNMGTVAVTNIFKTSLTTIEDKAFYECSKLRIFLVSTYTGLQSIGDYAFADCDTLAQPSVPKNVASVGTGCFMNCDNLKYVSFYGSIEEYPEDCFRNCPNLIRTGGTAAAFGGLKRIGANAYAGCVSLQCSTSWNLGKYTGLEEIGEGAFNGCSTLTDSSLSATITSVGAGAFSGCTGINNLVINATKPPALGGIALDTMSENFNILVPNSEADGDSVYKAYLKTLTDLLGEKDALRILDSVSDGARDRYEEELKKLTPAPTLESEETTEEITEEKQENEAGAELTPTPMPEEENPETTPEPTPAEDAGEDGETEEKDQQESSEDSEESTENTENQEENTDTANKENNPS